MKNRSLGQKHVFDKLQIILWSKSWARIYVASLSLLSVQTTAADIVDNRLLVIFSGHLLSKVFWGILKIKLYHIRTKVVNINIEKDRD